MANTMNRREFTTVVTMGLGAVALSDLQAQAPTRRLKIGHTGITWGFAPRDAEQAIKDVASLGYHGYESFGNVLETWEATGGLDKLLGVGLPAAAFGVLPSQFDGFDQAQG